MLGNDRVEVLLARLSVRPLDDAEEEALLREDPAEGDPLRDGRQDLVRLHRERVGVVEEGCDPRRGARHPVRCAVEAKVVAARPARGLLAREHHRGGVGEAPVRVHDLAGVVLELVERRSVRAVELAGIPVLRSMAVAPLPVALRVDRMLPAVVLPDQLGEDERAVRRGPVLAFFERSQFCLGHGCPSFPAADRLFVAAIEATPLRPA